MFTKTLKSKSKFLNQQRRAFAVDHSTPCIFKDLKGHGYLPSTKPMKELPSQFSALNQILDDMTIIQKNGTEGLLGQNKLRLAVDSELPNFMDELKKVDEKDERLNAALFRDFSMLSSAYLLEECHINYLATKNYGIGMDYLPEKLAMPMKFTADRIRYGQPLLEYAYGYALNNWKFTNDKTPGSNEYENDELYPEIGAPITSGIELIRKFHGSECEAGFVLIHVVIDSKTHHLTAAHEMMFKGAQAKDRGIMNKGLEMHLDTLNTMNDIFKKIWTVSSPQRYLDFRTFIMGVQGNDDIFPNGVLYKGVNESPQRYRGETGAQDSIIPSVDNAFGLDYPRNSLTEYLFQMRAYRPYNHQQYINGLRQQQKATQQKQFALEDSYSTYLMLQNIHSTFRFRHQHWGMVKKYIIDNTKYPRATGGTPITTWLPNQIGACLEQCQVFIQNIDGHQLKPEDKENFEFIKHDIKMQTKKLFEEVVGMQEDFDGQELDQFKTRSQSL